MRKGNRRLVAWGFALAFVAGAAGAAEITPDKLPQAVQEALRARFPDVEMTEAAKEKTPEGQDIFEVSLDDPNHNTIDVTITPEGTITLIEKQVTRKELPAPLAATLEKKYPKARYRVVEQVIRVKDGKETLTSYEVILLTPQKQQWAVELDLEGKILNEEKQDPEAED